MKNVVRYIATLSKSWARRTTRAGLAALQLIRDILQGILADLGPGLG